MQFTNQESGTNSVQFFPSGESVAAAGNDGKVRHAGSMGGVFSSGWYDAQSRETSSYY